MTPFHGVNKWPSEEDLPGFRETMEEYHKEMSCIANRCPVLLCMSVLHNLSHFWELHMSMLKDLFSQADHLAGNGARLTQRIL